MPGDLPNGVSYWPGLLDRGEQQALIEEIRAVVARAPLFIPRMPRTGKEMSVKMTNCGPLGWVTDKQGGYRYQQCHPYTAENWPPIPARLLDLWTHYANANVLPEACLINYYSDDARMGLHQDRDEKSFDYPVLSVSLGNDCLFRVGGTDRKAKTSSVRLKSGDVLTLSGAARMAFHGVDRIYPNTSDLLKDGGRVNLTLRRVTA